MRGELVYDAKVLGVRLLVIKAVDQKGVKAFEAGRSKKAKKYAMQASNVSTAKETRLNVV